MAFRFPSVIDLQRQNRTDTQRLFNQLGANAIANEAAAIKQQQLGQQLLLNAKQQQLDALKFDQTMEMRQKELDARIKAQESQERIANARISASRAYKAPSEDRLRFKAELDFHQGLEAGLIKELAGFDEATKEGEDRVTTMEERDAFLAQRRSKRAELEAQLKEVRGAMRETFESFEGGDTGYLPEASPVPSGSLDGPDPKLAPAPFGGELFSSDEVGAADDGSPILTDKTGNPQLPNETLFPDRGVPGPKGQPGVPQKKTYSTEELLMVGQKDNILGENARTLFRQSPDFKEYMREVEEIQDQASQLGIKEVTDKTAEIIQKLYAAKDYSTPSMIRADLAGVRAMYNSAVELKGIKRDEERQDERDAAMNNLFTSLTSFVKEYGDEDQFESLLRSRFQQSLSEFEAAGGDVSKLPIQDILSIVVKEVGDDPGKIQSFSGVLQQGLMRPVQQIKATNNQLRSNVLKQDVKSFIESLRGNP